MTADDFRRIVLGMDNVVEGAHMGHPDFRVNGRIFATIHPDHRHGMVKLTPDQQQEVVGDHPAAFAPENGAWGRQGCTRVRFDSIDADDVGAAITRAWQNAVSTPTRTKPPRTGARSRRSRAR